MTRKILGKIQSATFGFGGYQDAEMSFDITFSMEGSGVGTSFGFWAYRSDHAQWTIEEQHQRFAYTVELLRDTLRAAKKQHVAQLPGTPVELAFEGSRLLTWRVLEEVL